MMRSAQPPLADRPVGAASVAAARDMVGAAGADGPKFPNASAPRQDEIISTPRQRRPARWPHRVPKSPRAGRSSADMGLSMTSHSDPGARLPPDLDERQEREHARGAQDERPADEWMAEAH